MSQRVVGPYRILDRLGEGLLGAVYRAIDATGEREVAVRILRPDFAGPEIEARLRYDALTLARLNHPNIAVLHAVTREGDDLLVVTELVNGESLKSILARSGAVAPATAVAWSLQVLEALECAHRNGIVHRDLKPGNVMVTETGMLKVVDFAIAGSLRGHRGTQDTPISAATSYASPEEARGDAVDGRSDIYSLGVVLHELVAGQLPVEAPRPHLLPDWLDAAVTKALATAPVERHQTASEFRDVLHRGLFAMDAAALSGTYFDGSPHVEDAGRLTFIDAILNALRR